MSYYRVRTVRLKKNGTISITAADNNVRPLEYFTTEYKGSLAEFLYSVFEGNFQIAPNKGNELFTRVLREIERLGKLFDEAGLDFSTQFTYKLTDREDAIREACEMYAERMKTNDWSNPESFGRTLCVKIMRAIERGQENLVEAKKRDLENGVVRISCAAYSIFEGYDLLKPKDENNGFILAPQEDYNNCGVLKTNPENIIRLGQESDDMYVFLSHTGLGRSMQDYINMIDPRNADNVRTQFAKVSRMVQGLLDKGLRLKTGVSPFEGNWVSVGYAA